jgi:hypothetical protein
MCPYCRQNAPLVYRGVVPYCTACGNLRGPLTSRSVNMAGKPAKVGGAVARVAGWLVLVVGLSLGLGVGLLAYALASPVAGLAVALPFVIISLAIGLGLLKGGGALKESGKTEQRDTREQAVYALAAHRGGVLTAEQVAAVLGVPPAEADALLTTMAKEQSDKVTLDVDDQGGVYYRFANAPWHADSRFRVGVDPEEQARVAAQPAPETREPRVIDAELIDEAPAPRARSSAR